MVEPQGSGYCNGTAQIGVFSNYGALGLDLGFLVLGFGQLSFTMKMLLNAWGNWEFNEHMLNSDIT